MSCGNRQECRRSQPELKTNPETEFITVPSLDSEQIPEELRARKQWVLWRDVTRAGKPTKVPFDPINVPAKSNNPLTWSTFEDCLKAVKNFSGLGFVFAADDPYLGIDLDGCRDPETGKVDTWAAEILEKYPTYAEVSPSGTGVKMFVRGTLPSERCKAKIDVEDRHGKTPGIECYEQGRYFAITGQSLYGEGLGESEIREHDLTWLAETYFRPEPARSPRSHPQRDIDQGNVIERARAYMLQVDPAIEGQGGHDTTFRAACALVLGFALTPSEALPLLEEWNQTCLPPWSDRELLHKVESANQQGGIRGYLLEETRITPGPDSDVDLSGIINKRPSKRPQSPPEIKTLDEELLRPPGLISHLMDYYKARAMYWLPELAFSAALSLLSTLTGRKVCDKNNTRTNLFCLSIGPTGCGKDIYRQVNAELLIAAGKESLVGPEDFASGSAITNYLREHPCALCQIDEMGRFFENVSSDNAPSYLRDIVSNLLKLFTNSGGLWMAKSYADAKRATKIDQPHCVIHGSTTPGSFWESITNRTISDGLLGRFLVFFSHGYVSYQEPNRNADCDQVLNGVRCWAEFDPYAGNLPTCQVIQHEPEAWERLQSHILQISERRKTEDEWTAAIWSRASEKSAKLALLAACSRHSWKIEIEDVNWAIRVVNTLTRRLISQSGDSVAENKFDALCLKTLQKIREAGAVQHSALLKRMKLDAKTFRLVTATLQERGEITPVHDGKAIQWQLTNGN